MSLEQIGPLSNSTFGTALLLQTIAGHSENDATTSTKPTSNYTTLSTPKNLTIGLSQELKELCTNKQIYKTIEKAIEKLAKTYNWQIKNISLNNVDLAIQTYYPIVYTEFFSSTRKYDGRKFGKKIEEVCGPEVLRRILGGSEISKAEYKNLYYRRALKARNLIKQDFQKAFKQVDIIASPTTPELPHKIGSSISPEAMYAYDAFTIPANLTGDCAATLPAKPINKIPVGLHLTAPAFQEHLLLNTMHAWEQCR